MKIIPYTRDTVLNELQRNGAGFPVSSTGRRMRSRLALITFITVAALVGCTTNPKESTTQPRQTPQHFQKKITRTVKLDYLLFLPEGYKKSSTNKWPLMLFLHGAGERGTNLDKVTVHGPPKLVKTKKDFPFILVSPQCPDEQTWHDEDLLALLDDVMAKHSVDTNRVYLTGLSMGGYGTWSLGTKYPERFAALAPICGGGDKVPSLLASKEKKAAMKSLGVWAFHGAKDPVVPVEESQRMTNAIMRAGCEDVKLTVYPEASHDSWTEAYNTRELYDWLLAHRRGE
jgi:predicted peptidase